jgi:hypothetical protein
MRRISKAAAGAAAAMALLSGVAGAALAATAATGPNGAVRVCNPTAIEYGNTAPCETSNATMVEYA